MVGEQGGKTARPGPLDPISGTAQYVAFEATSTSEKGHLGSTGDNVWPSAENSQIDVRDCIDSMGQKLAPQQSDSQGVLWRLENGEYSGASGDQGPPPMVSNPSGLRGSPDPIGQLLAQG